MKVTTSIWSMAICLLAVVGLSGCNKVNELIVTPKQSSVPLGFELQLKAETLYSKGTVIDVTESESLNWVSSDESIAMVSSSGLVS
ncbi:Ig-like domain-containing protein, partial [Vibrio owensii]|uniref:Ig-like domain-containing protein n=1 Tax=Vibrio owensii TaxID=696485 RepID=UPI000587E46E